MSLWIVASLLSLAMMGLVLAPLFRGRTETGIQPADVYKAQLNELTREEASGLLSAEDATAARAEISRRLLRAESQENSSTETSPPQRLFALSLLVIIPGLAIVLYAGLGRPDLPSQPFALRNLEAESAARIGPMAAELEQRLAEIPDPADRAMFLGNTLASLGAFEEATESYLTVLSYRGEDAPALTRIGELLLVQADGIVSASSVEWFDRALASEPLFPRATYYRALHDLQQGDFDAAETRLTELLQTANEEASWIEQVSSLLDEVRTTRANLPEGAGAMLALDEEARSARIREMVAGLAARLETSPDDFEGWLRLANAYGVLGERDDAQRALLSAQALAQGEPRLETRVAEIAASFDIPFPVIQSD